MEIRVIFINVTPWWYHGTVFTFTCHLTCMRLHDKNLSSQSSAVGSDCFWQHITRNLCRWSLMSHCNKIKARSSKAQRGIKPLSWLVAADSTCHLCYLSLMFHEGTIMASKIKPIWSSLRRHMTNLKSVSLIVDVTPVSHHQSQTMHYTKWD